MVWFFFTFRVFAGLNPQCFPSCEVEIYVSVSFSIIFDAKLHCSKMINEAHL